MPNENEIEQIRKLEPLRAKIDEGKNFSGLFAPMYKCSEHGEVWRTETLEEIDTERDEVYTINLCPKCHRSVTPLFHDGLRVMHPLTDKEVNWETTQTKYGENYE